MSAAQVAASTRGVVFIHCCPPAVVVHVEWAIAGVLGRPCKLEWSAQPAAPTHLRAEAIWRAPAGTGTKLAVALREWPMLRFEITEEPTANTDGERLSHVPGRGFHRSMMSASGDLVVGEQRLRALLAKARSGEDFAHGLHEILGSSWDAELEPYREAGDGSPVTQLHQVV
jgi:Protein of unknown function (DUF3145)